MKSKCNSCGSLGGRNSSYVRQSDRKKVIQFRCFRCKKTWTPDSETPEKHQKRRSENEILRRLLISAVTMNRAAWILDIDPKTVDRRVDYLAEIAEEELKNKLSQGDPVDEVYVDELITFEHTRCKPIAVFMAVSKNREILGFRVSSMPPIGKHLRKISHRKYGKRPNHRNQGVKECLEELKPRLRNPHFKSDEEPSYRRWINHIYPDSKHEAYPSKRATIAGQGELKDRTHDPIFPINQKLPPLIMMALTLPVEIFEKLSILTKISEKGAVQHNRRLIVNN